MFNMLLLLVFLTGQPPVVVLYTGSTETDAQEKVYATKEECEADMISAFKFVQGKLDELTDGQVAVADARCQPTKSY